MGVALGDCLSDFGYSVIFFDKFRKRVAELIDNQKRATSDPKKAMKNALFTFVTVPTPTKNGVQDLTAVLDITNKWISHASNIQNRVLIIKSTILPGTMEEIIIPYLKKVSDKKQGQDYGIILNSEFMTEIENTWTEKKEFILNPNTEYRIVLGEGENKQWGNYAISQIFSKFNLPIIRMDYTSAEFTKYVANTMLATKISFWNELFLLTRDTGVDLERVAEAVSLDQRIGKYGTVFGKAFGGKCLPKDLEAFVA